jgi:hypothetical protein
MPEGVGVEAAQARHSNVQCVRMAESSGQHAVETPVRVEGEGRLAALVVEQITQT